jgi:hypothetical protein
MLNIIENIHFEYNRPTSTCEYILIKGDIFECKLRHITEHIPDGEYINSFQLYDFKIRDEIVRREITLFFNALVTYNHNIHTWVKYTNTLDKMTYSWMVSNTNKSVIIDIETDPNDNGLVSYLGSIVLIDKPTVESLTTPQVQDLQSTSSAIKQQHVVNDDAFDMKDPNKYISDVTLVLDGGEKIPACKALLATVSPVFNSMFCGGCKERDAENVYIPDTEGVPIIKLINFSRTRNYNVEMDYKDINFVLLCHKYMIVYVVESWCRFMLTEVTHENVIDVFSVAQLLYNDRLINTCIRCIKGNPSRVDLNCFNKEELVKIFSTKT